MNRFLTPRKAALYESREELVANPVENWVVVKDEASNRRYPWSLRDGNGFEHERFQTKREAIASTQPGGWYHDRYQQELAWFDGVTPEGWQSWEAVKAELEERKAAEARRLAAEQRKITRMGVDIEEHSVWSKALDGNDPAAIRAAAFRMFEVLSSGNLMDIGTLEKQEAAGVFRELSDSWGFGTAAWDWLHQIKYLGLHEGKSAVEVLEMMDREEEDARRYELTQA